MDKIKPLDQMDPIVAGGDSSNAKVNKIFQKTGSIMEELMRFASSVPDFRRTDRGNLRHRLSDVIMLMVLGRASGCVGRADIIEFGRHNINRLIRMGMLKNGVPSEATLCRMENGIDDLAMADRMRESIGLFHRELCGSIDCREIICIDGKAERGTVLENGRNPDIVGAWSFNAGMTLANEACQEKSNEIKAVPLLLKKIDISGKVVTADAMSMQKDIIDMIREKGGDFIIELKPTSGSCATEWRTGSGSFPPCIPTRMVRNLDTAGSRPGLTVSMTGPASSPTGRDGAVT